MSIGKATASADNRVIDPGTTGSLDGETGVCPAMRHC